VLVKSYLQAELGYWMLNRGKEFREGSGWSQGELARRLGVLRQTINVAETDK
jgi:putative transcriptional regulator